MSAGPAAAHRPQVRRKPAPRAPRRVSGPARGRATTRQAAGAVALPQPAQPLAPRLVDILVGLPDARWLDRLMRGRAWIALIALALIGLVFMQVSMLGMNAGIGQKVERSATLERQNAELRASVSALSSPERIQKEATAMGMVQPAAGDVTFLRSRGPNADARVAAKIMVPPDLAAQQAATDQALAEQQAAAGLPPTPAAQQAQQEEAQAAGTVPGAATDEQAQAAAPPATEQPVQAQPQAQAQPQQAQPQTPVEQPQQTTTPQATGQTQQQPQATGATAAPGTGQ